MTTTSSFARGSHPSDERALLTHATIEAWKQGIVSGDWDAVSDVLAEDVAYHNPASLEPYVGKSALVTVLRTVFNIFQDFEYLREFSGESDYVLEFRARIGDAQLFGVDIIELNEHGLIVNLMVMIRPADVVGTLSAEAARRIGAAGAAAE